MQLVKVVPPFAATPSARLSQSLAVPASTPPPPSPQQQPIAIEYQLKDSCDAARNLSTLLDRRCLTTATQSSCYYIQCVSKNVPLLLCLHPHREEALRDTFV